MPTRRSLLAAALLATPADLAGAGLRRLAAAGGRRFGSEVLDAEFTGDPAYAALLRAQCDIFVPGLAAKWDHLQPVEGGFDFAPLDRFMAFAGAAGAAVRLHTLVWGLAMPPWLGPALGAGRGAALLAAHIAAAVGRYRGRVLAWDVVNEVADPRWPAGPEGLTLTPWRRALGPGYVATAFRLARAADPAALLFVNDDGLEYDDATAARKRATYLRLLDGWLAAGVPIDGFGLQAHLTTDRSFAPAVYRRFLADLAARGLVLHVTEFDVRMSAPVDDRAIAVTARRVLDVALAEPALRAVLCWGLADRYSDLGAAARATPYDRDLAPKRLRAALAAAFTQAAPASPAARGDGG